MAKSIVSLAVGLALEEKKIRSLDDWTANYVHGLAGSAYGETSIRNLLRMSSGVRFSEVYDGKDDLAKFTALRSSQGSIKALRAFSDREVQQGTRFHYATSETVALAALLRSATGNNLSEYLTERLWQPMGAEADATWIKAGDGLEMVAEASMQFCGIMGGSGSCWPTMEQSGRGKSCPNTTCWKLRVGATTPKRSRQCAPRRTSDTAISFGPTLEKSGDLRCLVSTVNQSSLTRNSSLSW